MLKLNLLTPQEFQAEIEAIVRDTGTDYFDAIMVYVQKNEMEIETAAELIKKSPTIKNKLAAQCSDINLIKQPASSNNKLPL